MCFPFQTITSRLVNAGQWPQGLSSQGASTWPACPGFQSWGSKDGSSKQTCGTGELRQARCPPLQKVPYQLGTALSSPLGNPSQKHTPRD